jgi:hypothetical protein
VPTPQGLEKAGQTTLTVENKSMKPNHCSTGVSIDEKSYRIESRCDTELEVPIVSELLPTQNVAFVSVTGLTRSMHYNEASGTLHLKAETNESTSRLDLLVVLDTGES